ncbi:MAG: sigma 54-interacting transcriptional regulator, partial [Chlorobiales bacterium]|nr:sigma 54-interacting transcriptional regulator [Chlorobiales bacterium]
MSKKSGQFSLIESPTEAILESISDGVFTVNLNWKITWFNRAAEKITGVSREDAIGRFCSEVFRSSMCEASCPLRRTLQTEKPIINKSGFIINAGGDRIPISVSTAVLRNSKGEIVGGAETFRDLSEVEALRKELEGRFNAGDLISRSPAMRKLFDLVPAIASSPSTVLIQGETGTGKELLAKAIHTSSPRAKKPFVAVNCGALPDTLLESELFGFKKGAFTGAMHDKPGRFALAKDGTLFLDEIGEVSPALQVRLLRVLQEHTYEPLGSVRSEQTHARIIAATNRNLSEMVKVGQFRQDLFYRINVVCFQLPPLRDRKEDIPVLSEHFIENFNRIQNKSILGLTPEAQVLFMGYDWPGNVRELQNVVERAFVLCSKKWIDIEHLPQTLTASRTLLQASSVDMASVRQNAEAQTILAALARNGFNRLAT